MKTARKLLDGKGRQVASVQPGQSVFDAMQLMAEKNVGALLVIDTAGKLVGIISERDFARKMYRMDKPVRDVPVSEIMTGKVAFVRPEQTSQECMALMSDKHVRHLPVMENDQVIGIISIGDLVKDTLAEQEFIIKQLENYIHG
jgi:CBS domain-containing protein